MEVREIMLAVGGRVGGWVGGRSHVHFIATLWSNLQVCKISSQAEIPKLDRVWQKSPDPDQSSGMYFAVNEKKDHSQKPNMKKGQEL